MEQGLPPYILARKYSEAARLTDGDYYQNCSNPEGYIFGDLNGLGVLKLIDPSTENPVVFDIGAGNGVFLNAVLEYYKKIGKVARGIGLVAVRPPGLQCGGAEILEGDFLRPEMWHPKSSIPDDKSLDLAVAYQAFMHFADPLRGVRIAMGMLKPGASLLASELHLCLELSSAGATVEALLNEISRLSDGSCNPEITVQPDYIEFENLRFIGGKADPFGQFDVVDLIKTTSRAVYALRK